MRSTLITIAETLADQVFYSRNPEFNLAELKQSDNWVCHIEPPVSGRGTTGQSHSIAYTFSFSFVKAYQLEANEIYKEDAVLSEAIRKCMSMLNGIIASGKFTKLPAWGITDVQESEYDVNFIGKRITIELTPIDVYSLC